jgi:putative phosphoribosyl transferase
MDAENLMQIFRDRRDAGAQLALQLQGYAERPDAAVLALGRPGVLIGYELATRLLLPLNMLVLNRRVPDRAAFDAVIGTERRKPPRREGVHGARAVLDIRDKTIILADDGLAAKATMTAVVEWLIAGRPAGIVIAVPTSSAETFEALRPLIDEMISLRPPRRGHTVPPSYRDPSLSAADHALHAKPRVAPHVGIGAAPHLN